MGSLLTSEHYYVFLSSCAEIFGTLVGLISLVYVYKTESIRGNIERSVETIDRVLKKTKFPDGVMDGYHNLEVKDLKGMAERLQEYFTASDFGALQSAIQSLNLFSEEMRSLKQAFKRSAISAFVVLFSTLLGLAVPFHAVPGLAECIFVVNLGLVLVSSYLSVRFVRELTMEMHHFSVASD